MEAQSWQWTEAIQKEIERLCQEIHQGGSPEGILAFNTKGNHKIKELNLAALDVDLKDFNYDDMDNLRIDSKDDTSIWKVG